MRKKLTFSQAKTILLANQFVSRETISAICKFAEMQKFALESGETRHASFAVAGLEKATAAARSEQAENYATMKEMVNFL